MKSFPNPLTPSEEKYYMQKYTEGDLQAKHVLIERNLRLVAHVIKKYQYLDEDPEDLISIGTIGLIKAVVTFNPDKGNRLAAYASKCVEKATPFLWLHFIPKEGKHHPFLIHGVFGKFLTIICTSFIIIPSPHADIRFYISIHFFSGFLHTQQMQIAISCYIPIQKCYIQHQKKSAISVTRT